MLSSIILLLNSISCTGLEAGTQCDLFHNGLLCSLDPISNIVGALFDLPSELQCQEERASSIACNS